MLFNHSRTRNLIQVIFFFIFIFLLTKSVNFLRFDPLLQIVTSIASRSFIISLIFSILLVIVPTIIVGRIFCGYVCPLGLLIEISSFLLKPVSQSITLRNLKYYHLVVILVLAGFGYYAAHLDPIASLTRAIANIQRPGMPIALIIILAILFLSTIEDRFFCRNLCPLGGLLGIISHISVFRLGITECSQCQKCEKICPTGAITNQTIKNSECILCYRCVDNCPDQAIKTSYTFQAEGVDMSKRGLITSAITSLFLIPFFRAKKLPVIRSPGSIPEEMFLEKCARCGACINICPTGGLQPDFRSFLTPKLIPRIGGCERYCNNCGQVCPTGAIRRLPLSEKEFVKIGTAIINRNRCLAWRYNQSCLICDEACPYGAIHFELREIDNIRMGRPIVDRQLCIGCGLCESRCPVAGPSAIVVYPEGEERKLTGSYRTEEKIKLRKETIEQEEEIPEGFIQ